MIQAVAAAQPVLLRRACGCHVAPGQNAPFRQKAFSYQKTTSLTSAKHCKACRPRQLQLRAQNSQHATTSGSWNTEDLECPHDVVLIADIGGTNCRFELWMVDLSDHTKDENLITQYYATKDFKTFEDALEALSEHDVFKKYPPKAAAFACAGPVINNKCAMTNLNWVIDGHSLMERYGIRMAVLNDFEAVGHGVPALHPSDLKVLNDVPAKAKGPKAVIGPGTGLGEAQLVWDDTTEGYRVFPSEGSHASFAPRGWKQHALAHFVEERHGGHVELEHVACGPGLLTIYDFLRSDQQYNRPHLDMTKERDPPSISKAALEGSDPLAVEAVDLLLSIVGAEAGHMALRLLATGGVYICGGITPKLISRVEKGGLLNAFLHKESRFHKLLCTFPLYVVINEGLGLLGTRQYARKLLQAPQYRFV